MLLIEASTFSAVAVVNLLHVMYLSFFGSKRLSYKFYLRCCYLSTSCVFYRIYGNLTLNVADPAKTYPTQDSVWQKFYSCFQTADGLIFYEEIFKAYFMEAISEFYVDNVQYIEFRALLNSVRKISSVSMEFVLLAHASYNILNSC